MATIIYTFEGAPASPSPTPGKTRNQNGMAWCTRVQLQCVDSCLMTYIGHGRHVASMCNLRHAVATRAHRRTTVQKPHRLRGSDACNLQTNIPDLQSCDDNMLMYQSMCMQSPFAVDLQGEPLHKHRIPSVPCDCNQLAHVLQVCSPFHGPRGAPALTATMNMACRENGCRHAARYAYQSAGRATA
jgi:hypothetical protein